MKKITITILALIAALLLNTGCKKNEATQYAQTLNDHHLEIVKKTYDLVKVFKSLKAIILNKRLRELKEVTVKAVKAVRNMEGYKGDTDLRDAYQDSFEFYLSAVDNEYTEIVGMLEERTTAFSQGDIGYIKRIQDKITAVEEPLDEDLRDAIKAFESKYNVAIDRSRINREIRRIQNL